MIKFRENEKIYLTTRRHWITLLFELLPLKLIFLAAIIGVILILIFISVWPQWLTDIFPALAEFNITFLLIFLVANFILIVWSAIFIIITDYYLDCWIVTDQRTVHTELKGLFNRTISVIQHEQIQDVSIDIHGFFPVMLNYGDVHIQTAGKFREFVFKRVPNPYQIKSTIFKSLLDLKKNPQNNYCATDKDKDKKAGEKG